jgi:hypothetical protein
MGRDAAGGSLLGITGLARRFRIMSLLTLAAASGAYFVVPERD